MRQGPNRNDSGHLAPLLRAVRAVISHRAKDSCDFRLLLLWSPRSSGPLGGQESHAPLRVSVRVATRFSLSLRVSRQVRPSEFGGKKNGDVTYETGSPELVTSRSR